VSPSIVSGRVVAMVTYSGKPGRREAGVTGYLMYQKWPPP